MSFSVTTITKERVAVQQSSHNDIRSVWSIDYWKPDLIHRFRGYELLKGCFLRDTCKHYTMRCPIFFIFLSLAAISHMQVLWLHNLTKQYSSTHLDVSAPPGLEDDMSDSISSRAEGIAVELGKKWLENAPTNPISIITNFTTPGSTTQSRCEDAKVSLLTCVDIFVRGWLQRIHQSHPLTSFVIHPWT